LTVKIEPLVTTLPSPLVTVMVRVPTVAPLEMEMLTLSDVALLNVVEFTVMPLVEKATVAPVMKLVPVMVKFWFTAPASLDVGETAVTVGAALTVKIEPLVPLPASGLVTVIARVPTRAPLEIEMLTVSVVALTKVVELTVMLDPEKEVVAPLTNPVPVTVKLWLTAPASLDVGETAVTVGAALTVKIEPLVALPASGFVTVMVLVPTVALPPIVTLTVSDVALLNVVELTVMPLVEKAVVAPLWKPVPVTVRF